MRGHIRVIKEIARGMYKSGNNERYLELGVLRAQCFNEVAPYFKTSVAVDINKNARKYIKGLSWKTRPFINSSTDLFFTFNNLDLESDKYNMIFIDAHHTFESGKRDFVNSYEALFNNGLIILHDTYPECEEHFGGCGDVYKVADWIKSEDFEGELMTLPFYYGLTIFRKCRRQLAW